MPIQHGAEHERNEAVPERKCSANNSIKLNFKNCNLLLYDVKKMFQGMVLFFSYGIFYVLHTWFF